MNFALIKGILKYTILGPCHWTATILSYIIVPFIVPLAKDGFLPNWLSWFQTGDNSLDGDNGWQAEHRPYLTTPYNQLSKFKVYLSRVLWLYRNPVYGLEKSVLSAKVTPGSTRKIYGTQANIGDRYSNPQYQTGQRLVVLVNGEGKSYAQWHGFYKLTETKSINWMIGWKLLFVNLPVEQTVNMQICTTLRSSKIFKD